MASPPKRPAQRLQQDVLSSLMERIVTGRLKPGSKIVETSLADELGVSRTPLREALQHLEREGFVRSDLHRGFTVEPLSTREVRETYPLLAALECFAVRSSASLLSLQLPELERINARFERARMPAKAQELDTVWHDTLISQSKNGRLTALVTSLRRVIRRYEHFYMADANLLAVSAEQHRDIIRAIESRNIHDVIQALEQNYTFGMQVLLRKMGEE